LYPVFLHVRLTAHVSAARDTKMSVGGVSSVANAKSEADAHARRGADVQLVGWRGKCEAAVHAPRLVPSNRLYLSEIVILGPFLLPAEYALHLFQFLSASMIRMAVAADDFRCALSGKTSMGNLSIEEDGPEGDDSA